MKNNSNLITVLLCLATLSTTAQTGLTVSAGSSIFIKSSTIFSVDSLVLTPSADFTISGANTEIRNAVVTHSTANPYIQRVFHFSNTLPAFNGDLRFYYRIAELNSIPENLLTLNVNNGSAWSTYNLNTTRDAVNKFVAVTGLTNLVINELTLANTNGPLPVSFILFNSTCIDGGVKLSWTTAQEINSKNFYVEKSSDGRQWQTIAAVAAAGNSSVERKYSYDDNKSIGNAFYRIAENDLDGKQTVSAAIKSACANIETFAIHPNPVHDMLFVSISVFETTPVQLRLFDSKGSVVKQLQTNLLKGNNGLQLNTSGLPKGAYVLVAKWGTNSKSIKVVKE